MSEWENRIINWMDAALRWLCPRVGCSSRLADLSTLPYRLVCHPLAAAPYHYGRVKERVRR